MNLVCHVQSGHLYIAQASGRFREVCINRHGDGTVWHAIVPLLLNDCLLAFAQYWVMINRVRLHGSEFRVSVGLYQERAPFHISLRSIQRRI